MDGRDFSLRLKKIKAEVLAFKQYQKSGVGRADFYRYEFGKDQPWLISGETLTVKFYFNSTTQPIFQIFYIAGIISINWSAGVLTISSGAIILQNEIITIAQRPYNVVEEVTP